VGVKVVVIGLGYVGLPLAISASKAGHKVTGLDSNSDLVFQINGGESPIEDISDIEIKDAIKSNNFVATSNSRVISEAEIILICVPTPLNEGRKPDLSYLEVVVNSIVENLENESTIILESTVAPGTTRGFLENKLKASGKKFNLAYSPERIDPRNQDWNIGNTPKLVSGITEESLRIAVEFYQSFIKNVIPQSSIEVVETAKLLENSFRLVNITLINEISMFCKKLKIDVREVIQAASTKPYGFMPFYPGVGVGGHCIPVDPRYLTSRADELGTHLQIIDLALEINRKIPSYFVNVAKEKLVDLKNKNILVVGISYKPNVSDIRESSGIQLIQELRTEGANVSWNDELVGEWLNEKSTPISNNFDLIILANPNSSASINSVDKSKILDTRGGY
jgi:UDP-N-acetyl-D-glucosamine dehydrogenase